MVSIFTREITDDLTSLVKNIDDKVAENSDKQLKAFVILLTDDPDAAEQKLVEVAEKNGIKNVPLTVFDGSAGPPNYKIAKDSDTTVMMWNKLTVKVNHSVSQDELDKKKVAEIVSDVDKILN